MDRDSIVLPVPAISHHKLLGILCALPISVLVEDKEFMVVHLFVFFPLVLWLIARKGALLTERGGSADRNRQTSSGLFRLGLDIAHGRYCVGCLAGG